MAEAKKKVEKEGTSAKVLKALKAKKGYKVEEA